MFEAIVLLLIQICFVVLVCYLVIWVLGIIGISLPPKVVQIFWVIVALVVILLLFRALGPLLGGRRLLGLVEMSGLA